MRNADYAYKKRNAKDVEERNRFVAALVKSLLVLHSELEGKTERLCQEWIERGKTVCALSGEPNRRLIERGAVAVDPGRANQWIGLLKRSPPVKPECPPLLR